MQTEIVLKFDPKDYDCVSEFTMALMVGFSQYMQKNGFDIFYQMPLTYSSMKVTWGCSVEAPIKPPQKKTVMPVETEDGDLLL